METLPHILVTGGNGLIGGFLTAILLERGHAVTVLDTAPFEEGSLPGLGAAGNPRLTYVQGSVTDACIWPQLPRTFQYMVHCAALLGIERVPRYQIETLDSSIAGTRACLDFASGLRNLERLVYLSTSEIYGIHSRDHDENEPAVILTDSGRWCYASAKLSAEFYVKAFAERFGFQYTIVRPFNVYGPAPTSSIALPVMVRRAVANETIFVSGTGNQTRSWCHIQDFVEGLTGCMFFEPARNETINLGNETTEISLIELARMITRISQSSSRIEVQGDVRPDVLARRPNLQRAKELLDFKPTIGLAEGIASMAGWARGEERYQRPKAATA
jgi:nucleoside-diphosphate-sugar epimerase